ncbi:uncharacterized protein BYT42DRAFT_636322 [Radiomyces spectabilis]|uniref:uncharacterized protein n=1 Tax=Radiomyces spectabilis TaxID=64574 RepID=UPI002220C2CD|nr:uncharacterized protein BYT42DRAFT_636322 [Radiomyces spectabilis]KAI8379670.1 hypothetical protein BYT42DRAFT_636322 [Radiomyces spectabilis]
MPTLQYFSNAYMNNVKYRFGQHLRSLVNLLLDIKNRRNNRKVQLQNEGLSQREISARLTTEIYEPAKKFKLDIARKNSHIDSPLLPHYDFFQPFFNPAFYRLSCLFSQRGWRSFTCFPICTAWSPRYMLIDTQILYT